VWSSEEERGIVAGILSERRIKGRGRRRRREERQGFETGLG
jgi:hypothetical protein